MSKYKMFRRRIFPNRSGRVVVGQYFGVFWANPLATRTRPSIRAENRTRLDLIHHRMASFSFHDHRLGHLDLHQRHSPTAASPVITFKTNSTPALRLFTRHQHQHTHTHTEHGVVWNDQVHFAALDFLPPLARHQRRTSPA
jgi:hypothetical protein